MKKLLYAILRTEKIKRNIENLRKITAHVDRTHKKSAL